MESRVARAIEEYRGRAAEPRCPMKDQKNPAVQRAMATLTKRLAEVETALAAAQQARPPPAPLAPAPRPPPAAPLAPGPLAPAHRPAPAPAPQERAAALAAAEDAARRLEAQLEEGRQARGLSAARDAEAEAVRGQLREERARASRLEGELRDARREAARAPGLEERLRALQEEGESLRADARAAAEGRDRLAEENRALREAALAERETEARLAEARGERDEAGRRCRALEATVAELREAVRRGEEARERADRDWRAGASEEARDRVKALEAQVARMESGFEAERAHGKAGWERARALEEQLSELRVALGRAGGERDAARDELRAGLRRADEAQAARDILVAANEKLMARLEGLAKFGEAHGAGPGARPAAPAARPASAPRRGPPPCAKPRAVSAGRGPSASLMQPTASAMSREGIRAGPDQRWRSSLRRSSDCDPECQCPDCADEKAEARRVARERSRAAVDEHVGRVERARAGGRGCFCHPADKEVGMAQARRGAPVIGPRAGQGAGAAPGSAEHGEPWAAGAPGAQSPRPGSRGPSVRASAEGPRVGVSWRRAEREAQGIVEQLRGEYEALEGRYHALVARIAREGGATGPDGVGAAEEWGEELSEVMLSMDLKSHQLAALRAAFGEA